MNQMQIEIAHARKLQPDKGEDDVLVRSQDDAYLLAVADGISMANGRYAAGLVIDILRRIECISDSRGVLAALREALPGKGDHADSATTLTCGILRLVETGSGIFMRLQYFGIGDSPVWRVVRLPVGGRYGFQRYVVHGAPYPSETAKVYAAIRPFQTPTITGSIAFGSVDIPLDEVLVVCTDGIPERDVFGRDQLNAAVDERTSTLSESLFGAEVYNENTLLKCLDNYEERGLLYDDATIIVARLRDAPQVALEVAVAEPEEFHSQSDETVASRIASEIAIYTECVSTSLIDKSLSESDSCSSVASDDGDVHRFKSRKKARPATAKTRGPKAPSKRSRKR